MEYVSWFDLKQYKVSSVFMRKYMLDMIKVVICLRHHMMVYKPIYVSMQLRSDRNYAVYAYSCNFNQQRMDPSISNELIDKCIELAQSLLKRTQR